LGSLESDILMSDIGRIFLFKTLSIIRLSLLKPFSINNGKVGLIAFAARFPYITVRVLLLLLSLSLEEGLLRHWKRIPKGDKADEKELS